MDLSRHQQRNSRVVPALLVLLSVVPVVAGAARLVELSSNVEITTENARFFASPLPVIIHILSVTIYSIGGAFQFAGGLRLRKPAFHRVLGKILIPVALLAAISGLWMTLFYPWPIGDGLALFVIRLVVGSAMLLAIVASVIFLRQRNYLAHGEWMLRAYAIGIGAGTQVFTHLPWVLLLGRPSEPTRAILMGAGWAINILIAEWVIHQNRVKSVRTV